jgi:hypothetical protein
VAGGEGVGVLGVGWGTDERGRSSSLGVEADVPWVWAYLGIGPPGEQLTHSGHREAVVRSTRDASDADLCQTPVRAPDTTHTHAHAHPTEDAVTNHRPSTHPSTCATHRSCSRRAQWVVGGGGTIATKRGVAGIQQMLHTSGPDPHTHPTSLNAGREFPHHQGAWASGLGAGVPRAREHTRARWSRRWRCRFPGSPVCPGPRPTPARPP